MKLFSKYSNLCEHTPWAIKKGATFIFMRTLANVADFNNSFTVGFVDKLRNTVK